MSLDRSLKTAAGLTRRRGVLTRAERLVALAEEDRWTEGQSVFGLPKVAVKKIAKKRKAAAEEAAPEAEAPSAEEATADE